MSTDNQVGHRDSTTTQNETIIAAPIQQTQLLEQNLTQTQRITTNNFNTTQLQNGNQQFQIQNSNNANKSRPTQNQTIQASSATTGTLQFELDKIHNSIVAESNSKQQKQNQIQTVNLNINNKITNKNIQQKEQQQPSNLMNPNPNQNNNSIVLSTDAGPFKSAMRDIDTIEEEEEDIEVLDINNNQQQKWNGNVLSQQSFGDFSDDFYARIEEYDLPKQRVMKNGMAHNQTFSIYNTDLYDNNMSSNTKTKTSKVNTFNDKYGINAYYRKKERHSVSKQNNNNNNNNFSTARNVLNQRSLNPYSQNLGRNNNGRNDDNNIRFMDVMDDIKRSKDYNDKKNSIVMYPLDKNENYTNGLNYYEIKYKIANPMLWIIILFITVIIFFIQINKYLRFNSFINKSSSFCNIFANSS